MMLRKFMLTGMKYAVDQQMNICGQIRDKCCTLSDELKITKLWSQKTGPILMQHID